MEENPPVFWRFKLLKIMNFKYIKCHILLQSDLYKL